MRKLHGRAWLSGPALAASLLLAACANSPAAVQQKEDLLAAAGFVQRPADSPERLAALRSLPPHRFVRQVANGQVTWLYADPTVCACLYVGGQAAYGRYQQQVLARHLADERLMTAQTQEMAASWDWGPWGGPGWWYGPGYY